MTERALKNLSISVFIKVLPTFVPRILATHRTTMINGDGGCRCKGGHHFLIFFLSNAKEANLDDRPRDIQHSASNVLLDVLGTTVNAQKHQHGHQVKVGLREHKNPLGTTCGISHTTSSWEVTKRLNQDTTIIVLPARCVHFTGIYIIVLGRSFNHHIYLRFRSGW